MTRIQTTKIKRDGRKKFATWFLDNFRAQSIYFYRLVGLTLFLVIFGLVMVLSSSSIDSLVANRDAFYVFGRQSLYAMLGLFAMLVFSSFPVSLFKKQLKVFLLVAFALQLAVPFVGISVNGNKNWISIAGFSVQPSEFLKLGLIAYMAWFIANRESELDDTRRVLAPLLAVGGAALVLVMVGRDLGTATIMAIIIFGILIIAGLPLKPIGQVALVLIALAAVLTTTSSSRMLRISAWLNPDSPASAAFNWQFEHGTWALAAGGIFGVGLGNSKMKWSWIPEVENDFIFAVIGEELGFIGALVVIGMLGLLVATLISIALRSDSTFQRLATLGIAIWVMGQSIVNIAVVLGLLPVLGVPLPLISAGGSSLISTLMGIGVVLAFEKHNHRQSLRVARR